MKAANTISSTVKAVTQNEEFVSDLYLPKAFLDMEATNGYTNLELHAAFSLIKNEENWKEAIEAEINAEDYEICAEACHYIAGSHLVVVEEYQNGTIRVVAAGYYDDIGY